MSVEILRPFRPNYELEVEPKLDRDAPGYTFPQGAEDGLAVAVSVDQRRWTGIFAYESDDSEAATKIVTFPDPDRVCVVARGGGYVVNVRNPDDWYEIEAMSIRDVRPVIDRGLLLFTDLASVVAYVHTGFLWRTERISWDGVKLIAVEGSNAWARGWDAPNERTTTVRIDLRTGESVGASAPS